MCFLHLEVSSFWFWNTVCLTQFLILSLAVFLGFASDDFCADRIKRVWYILAALRSVCSSLIKSCLFLHICFYPTDNSYELCKSNFFLAFPAMKVLRMPLGRVSSLHPGLLSSIFSRLKGLPLPISTIQDIYPWQRLQLSSCVRPPSHIPLLTPQLTTQSSIHPTTRIICKSGQFADIP